MAVTPMKSIMWVSSWMNSSNEIEKHEPREPRFITSPSYKGTDRREYNGRDWTSLRAWAQAIGLIGIPGTIALYVVYIGATEIPKISQKLEVLVTETRQNRELIREHTQQMLVLTNIQRRTCSNAAKDEYARQRCFDE
jgi:hypothetical protein